MIKINSIDSLVGQLLQDYKIWRDHRAFYHNENHCDVDIDRSGIPIYHYTDIEKINSEKQQLIFIDCLTEGLQVSHYFQKYSPDKKYVIFSCGDWEKERVGLQLDYEIIQHDWFLFEMTDGYFSPHRFCFYLDKEYYFDYPKPYVFVSTIGNVRNSRTRFVDLLTQNLTFKNYILKYSGKNYGMISELDVIDIVPGQFDPYISLLPKYYHNVSQTLPIDLYNRAYFNLVVESQIDKQHGCMITEKTIKALLTGIPFVILSSPGILQRLKALGFETYQNLWDEKYDAIDNFEDRVNEIARLVESLSKFDWQKNQKELEYIKFKNRSNFLSLNRAVDCSFMKLQQLLQRIETNAT